MKDQLSGSKKDRGDTGTVREHYFIHIHTTQEDWGRRNRQQPKEGLNERLKGVAKCKRSIPCPVSTSPLYSGRMHSGLQ